MSIQLNGPRGYQCGDYPSVHPLNNPASSTPVANEQHVYVYFGTYGLLCFDHAGKKVWERKLDPPRSKYGMATSPILYKDTVILVLDSDGGSSRLLAVHRDTGATVWEQPRSLFRAGWSTPMIFRHGEVEELEESIFATPAIVQNRIYLRTAGHLFALGE